MPVFDYKAKDPEGNTVRGAVEVPSHEHVVEHLRAQGYFPMQVQAQTAAPSELRNRFSWGLALSPVKPRSRALFFRHLAETLKAGITPARALHSCEPRTQDPRLRKMIREWIPQVEGGTPLSVVMVGYPQICPPVIADILHAAEKGGFLDAALNLIAEDLELEVEVRQQLKWHMFYYKIIFSFVLLVPPLPHIITLQSLSLRGYFSRYLDGFTHTTLPIVIAVCAGWLLFRVGNHIPALRKTWGVWKMSFPGSGLFVRNLSRSRFLMSFSCLVKAGVPLTEALRSAAPTCGVEPMERALLAAAPALEQGEKLTDVLERSGQLGREDLQAIATGEEAGTLFQSLERLASYYRTEVRASLKNLANVLKVPLGIAALFVVLYVVAITARAYFDRMLAIGDQMMNF